MLRDGVSHLIYSSPAHGLHDNTTAKSSLPVVRHAMRTERVAADSRLDRMTIWMQNVESELSRLYPSRSCIDHPPICPEVVQDARQNFASTSVTPLPPLPLAPLSRSASQTHRISRLPRKVLAANQIFTDDGPIDQTTSFSTSTSTPHGASDRPLPQLPSENIEAITHSPQRTRRATVSTRSPDPVPPKDTFDISTGSPSKRKEKCRSHGNLAQPISPIARLEFELQRRKLIYPLMFSHTDIHASPIEDMPTPVPRLSAVLDRSLFIATPLTSREDTGVPNVTLSMNQSVESDELTSSPFHVEPYPPRKTNSHEIIPDTPNLRRLEGVYDRFLMATSGVKRLGRGYQSDNAGPVLNNPQRTASQYKRNPRVFSAGRRRMPPPVSSADLMQTVSVDELGVMTYGAAAADCKDEGNTTTALVRRAFKAIASRTVSRREP